MLAVDTLNLQAGLPRSGPLHGHAYPSTTRIDVNPAHPPRAASLPSGPVSTSKSRANAPATRTPIQTPRAYKDVRIDHWTKRIFSIISNGPAGGFVSYAISPTNELFVDRTGNRAAIEDVISDLLPKDSCRYIAYKLRFALDNHEKHRVIWLMWTPKDVQQADVVPFLNGLAGTLIGLNCPSSIPIVRAKTADEITEDTVLESISKRRGSESTSSADSVRTSNS